MIIKASRHSALIVTAGLLALVAGPVMAATDGDNSASDSKSAGTTTLVTHHTYKHASHHRRDYVHRKSHSVASKADEKEADKAAIPPVATPDENKPLSNIPLSIANANAQMLLAGVQLSAAAAIPSGSGASAGSADNSAGAAAEGGTFMVAADQLNDVDRSLQEGNSAPAMTSSPQSTSSSTAPAATLTGDSSTLDQTSLIGKIFIGFGALLTMASAARMFIG